MSFAFDLQSVMMNTLSRTSTVLAPEPQKVQSNSDAWRNRSCGYQQLQTDGATRLQQRLPAFAPKGVARYVRQSYLCRIRRVNYSTLPRKERTVIMTETPAQSGRAFNLTYDWN